MKHPTQSLKTLAAWLEMSSIYGAGAKPVREAADEIERLRAEVERLRRKVEFAAKMGMIAPVPPPAGAADTLRDSLVEAQEAAIDQLRARLEAAERERDEARAAKHPRGIVVEHDRMRIHFFPDAEEALRWQGEHGGSAYEYVPHDPGEPTPLV